jgi:hypothetical protein
MIYRRESHRGFSRKPLFLQDFFPASADIKRGGQAGSGENRGRLISRENGENLKLGGEGGQSGQERALLTSGQVVAAAFFGVCRKEVDQVDTSGRFISGVVKGTTDYTD